MDLKKLFNSYVTHGLHVRLNNLDGKVEWNNKISIQDGSQNIIESGWVTKRIFYDGSRSENLDEIYDYLYNRLGIKGESVDNANVNFENFHFQASFII